MSGPATHDERRLFRFHNTLYYFEVFQWYLKDGRKYIDGKCKLELDLRECEDLQWLDSDIQNGSVPEFFNKMDGLFYPKVTNINLS